MTIYDIYSYSNGEDDSPVIATITLSESGSEVVSIISADPSIREEAESVLRDYMSSEDDDEGMTARQAVLRYGGSYGEVRVSNPDGSPAQAIEAETV